MDKHLETLKATRKLILNFTCDLSIDELNEIPGGFNNNIIWNMAHIVATQQGVCYRRATLEMKIDTAFYEAYKPDSKPDGFIGTDGLELIKNLLISTIAQFETDYKNNLFNNYQPWITSYGVELNDIEAALSFLPFHEGMHTGYIMALKRIIKNKK